MKNYPYYPSYVKEEITYTGDIEKGQLGPKAKRVQEWLSIHNFGTSTDGDFGPATELCVRDFQKKNEINNTGIVNKIT